MGVIYVTEQNSTISKEGARLLIKKDNQVLHTLHSFKIDQIIIFGKVFLTPAALSYLLTQGIDTAFMTQRGRYIGRLQPPHGKNIVLRREQFKKMEDPDFCLKTSRYIVQGKLANLRTILLRLNRTREDINLDNSILTIRRLIDKVKEAKSLDSVRGYEGRGTVIYFEGFAKGFLSKDINFQKRVRRPPTDPVNVLLSLGYTLLLNTVMASISMVGFDPYLGTLHALEYGRPSLALDLMEEWRPIIVDSLVLSIFNLKVLSRDDFAYGIKQDETEEGLGEEQLTHSEKALDTKEIPAARQIQLTDGGFRKFIAQFERKMAQKTRYHLTGDQLSYRDCIREQVRHFARYLRGEDETYIPVPLK